MILIFIVSVIWGRTRTFKEGCYFPVMDQLEKKKNSSLNQLIHNYITKQQAKMSRVKSTKYYKAIYIIYYII